MEDPHDTPEQPQADGARLPEGTGPSDSPADPRAASPGAWQASNLLGLVNGVIVAVGGVFITTSSVIITLIASVVALLIALMIMLKS